MRPLQRQSCQRSDGICRMLIHVALGGSLYQTNCANGSGAKKQDTLEPAVRGIVSVTLMKICRTHFVFRNTYCPCSVQACFAGIPQRHSAKIECVDDKVYQL